MSGDGEHGAEEEALSDVFNWEVISTNSEEEWVGEKPLAHPSNNRPEILFNFQASIPLSAILQTSQSGRESSQTLSRDEDLPLLLKLLVFVRRGRGSGGGVSVAGDDIVENGVDGVGWRVGLMVDRVEREKKRGEEVEREGQSSERNEQCGVFGEVKEGGKNSPIKSMSGRNT